MCDLCAKGFFDYEFNSADIDKISNFNEIASNFTYLCTSKFIKYNLTDTDHLLLKSKFYGKGKSGMYFCIFGSCQPLTSNEDDKITVNGKIRYWSTFYRSDNNNGYNNDNTNNNTDSNNSSKWALYNSEQIVTVVQKKLTSSLLMH